MCMKILKPLWFHKIWLWKRLFSFFEIVYKISDFRFSLCFRKKSSKTTLLLVKKCSKKIPPSFFTNVFVFQTIWFTKMTLFYAVSWAELRKRVEVAENSEFTNVFVFSYFRLSSYFSPTEVGSLLTWTLY